MAYKQNWIEYFVLLDANNSGTITVEDAKAAIPRLAALVGKPQDSAEVQALVGFILTFDANKDKAVTKEELLAGVEKLFVGKPVNALPAFWQDSIRQGFAAADLNKSGDLSLDEVTKLVTGSGGSSDAATIAAAYEWAKKQGSSGKYDVEAFNNVVYLWATSPNPIHEVHVLTAWLRKN